MRISDWSSDVCSSDLLFAGLVSGIQLNVGLSGALATLTAFHAQGLERSEEHTSELQSLMRISYAVFCLKKNIYTSYIHLHLVYFILIYASNMTIHNNHALD